MRKSFVELVGAAKALSTAKVSIPCPVGKDHKRSYRLKGIGAAEAEQFKHAAPRELALGMLASRGETAVEVAEEQGVKLSGITPANVALEDAREFFGITPGTVTPVSPDTAHAAMERAKGALPNGAKVTAGK